MNIITAILECLGREPTQFPTTHHFDRYSDTKAHTTTEDDTAAAASDFVHALRTAEKNGENLHRTLDGIVHETGWTENLAKAILNKLVEVLKAGAKLGGAMLEAIEKATEAAVGFAREHPVYATLIALGVLVVLSPWVIEALGFAELGPVEGTFASWWQSTYAGYVPKGSLFSFFQRLGMTWRFSKGLAEDGQNIYRL